MGKHVIFALLTAGVWLIVWAIGVVIHEHAARPWYRGGSWWEEES